MEIPTNIDYFRFSYLVLQERLPFSLREGSKMRELHIIFSLHCIVNRLIMCYVLCHSALTTISITVIDSCASRVGTGEERLRGDACSAGGGRGFASGGGKVNHHEKKLAAEDLDADLDQYLLEARRKK